ncbi:hypothetical protein T4B_8962 [Trichinella pseudospiralis]|uniref:Uncharacterized protein n=1 Tax=Trichinella pseudospiralis TaxID=6337 RepID=A0A0V1GBW7_TRIPS|nr:hypothetical protein T4B_8962 [Trichinella pseudospiralis]
MLTSQLMNGCLIYIASLPNVSFHHTAAVMVKLFGCWVKLSLASTTTINGI